MGDNSKINMIEDTVRKLEGYCNNTQKKLIETIEINRKAT